MRLFIYLVFGIAAAVFWASNSVAQPNDQGGDRRGPPPEAIAACQGKQAGEAVSFTTPRGDNLSATCLKMRGQLVAVPEGHPKKRRPEQGQEHQPPGYQ
ncbi:MAG: hypothetical protein MI867_01295 [Pseudomonadales bacterium]|nr:hypothetical protein [Pseudomonadales bacterium]